MRYLTYIGAFLCLTGVLAGPAHAAEEPARVAFDIEAQPLKTALNVFSRQSGLQVMLKDEEAPTAGVTAPKVAGSLSVEEALNQLLARSTLKYEFLNERTVRITASDLISRAAPMEQMTLAQNEKTGPEGSPANPGKDSPDKLQGTAVPEILVKGSRVLNADIKRTRDDIQPYVVFDKETIDRSGATTLDGFFKERLTMNSAGQTNAQLASSVSGNMSQINLRGLGTNQTLILVDGRRIASATPSGQGLSQPDINGIPLAAIERIEVLPTTASGIYGGAATGGVVNIILRRDYNGAEVSTTYGNSFDGDTALRRVDVAAGFGLEDGKTSIMMAASYSDQNVLTVGERDFVQRGRARILANNPAFFFNATTPPLGATANIRSSNGSPLFGAGTPNFTFAPVGYSGTGLAPLQANAGRYSLDLANSAQGFGAGNDLQNAPKIESGRLSVRRTFGSRTQAFVEFSASNNIGESPISTTSGTYTVPVTAPTNPFGQSVVVTVPIPQSDGVLLSDIRSRRAAAGVIVDLSLGWSAGADFTWNRSRNYYTLASPLNSATANINNGTLNIFSDTNTSLVDFSPYLAPPSIGGPFPTTLKDATVRLAGPLFSLPGGPLALSGSVEYLDEYLGGGSQVLLPGLTLFAPDKSQTTESVYLETKWPLISSKNAMPWARALEFQLAGRWDQYTITGATSTITNPTATSVIDRRTNKVNSINPTLGLRYQPATGITIRASYGTGFLPPPINQLIPNVPNPSAATLIDPRRGGPTTLPAGTVTGGGNSNLLPEDSKSRSVGLIFVPRVLPELRVSVDYTRINKTDEIRTLTPQQIIDNEAFLPGRVSRGSASADPLGVGIITAVNATAVNLAKTEVEAYDLALNFQESIGFGAIELFANATYQTHYKRQLLATSSFVENVGVTSTAPLKWRANGGVSWTLQQWTLGWNTRYFDSYLVADPESSTASTIFLTQGSRVVPSQMYHDFFTQYRFPAERAAVFGSNLLSDVEIRVGISNVFDDKPPFDAGNSSFFYGYFGDPRLRSYYVSLKKGF